MNNQKLMNSAKHLDTLAKVINETHIKLKKIMEEGEWKLKTLVLTLFPSSNLLLSLPYLHDLVESIRPFFFFFLSCSASLSLLTFFMRKEREGNEMNYLKLVHLYLGYTYMYVLLIYISFFFLKLKNKLMHIAQTDFIHYTWISN